MKSLMMLLQRLLADAGNRCHTSTLRDWAYAWSRHEHEGESFLTITLPTYAKDLERALDNGQVDATMFLSFKKGHGQLPSFLGGLLRLVFDERSGRLLDNPSIAAIQGIRQVTLAFSKIKKECSNERIQAAYSAYVECESDVRAGDSARSRDDLMDYVRMANLLWRCLGSRLDQRIFDGELTPAHGPGATADNLKGNQKWTLREWTDRLETIFPYLEFARAHRSAYAELDRVDFREPGRERPVKVIHVPKTLKTPRIIAKEPTAMMYMQQGIQAMMREEIRLDANARNFMCYDSQEPNRQLAREGSLSGHLATLDLKEASDRVSNQLVLATFARFPWFTKANQVVRSLSADVPGHGVIRLAKYASMGSALTFPLEALVFTTLVFLGIEKSLNRPLTQRDVTSFYGQVRVYGDDIVVPVEFVSSVIDTLHRFGAVVNVNKSFWKGHFRESCGGDFYRGYPVGVARVRREFPTSRKDGSEIVSLVAFRNNLFEIGGWDETVDWLDQEILRILPIYPFVTKDSAILGRWSESDSLVKADRMHPTLHYGQVRGFIAKDRTPSNVIDGYDALLKVLAKRGNDPFEDANHLLRSGRSPVVDIKLGWARP